MRKTTETAGTSTGKKTKMIHIIGKTLTASFGPGNLGVEGSLTK